MLLHSREGSGEHRPADINAHRRGEPQSRLSRRARRKSPASTSRSKRDLDPEAGLIDLYPQEITRVFLNLISNGFYAATKRKETGDETFEPTLKASTKSLGNKVRNPDPRQWHGHPLGSEGENVQSLLHHQAGRGGHRPWAIDEPRHRGETARRHNRRRYRSWRCSPNSSLRCRGLRQHK